MQKVFFVGDVALDEYYSADYFPKIKEKIIVHAMPSQMGGSMANAASVFAAFGNQPYFLTALNSGEITKKLLKGLQEDGINSEYMVFDDNIPDSKCIIILAEEEHTVFIPTLAIQRIVLDDKRFEELCNCEYIYTNLCEIRPLYYNGMCAKEIMEKIRACGVQIWCDLDCADLSEEEKELVAYTDVIFVNEIGAENLQKLYGKNWKAVLFEKGIKMIIATKAGEGCSAYQKGHEDVDVPGVPVDVVDVTGAGDTFGGSFLHAYRNHASIQECLEFANYTAARAVTGIGARYGAADAETVMDFIQTHNGEPEKYAHLFK